MTIEEYTFAASKYYLATIYHIMLWTANTNFLQFMIE